jgi:hypothetical protein
MTQANRRTEQRADGWAPAAQDVVSDAAQKVEEGSTWRRGGSRVDNGEVGTGVIVAGRLSTGREGWTEDLRAFMRERPMMGTALMIAAGYMAAKFLPMRRYQ